MKNVGINEAKAKIEAVRKDLLVRIGREKQYGVDWTEDELDLMREMRGILDDIFKMI